MNFLDYRKHVEKTRPDLRGYCDKCLMFLRAPGNFRCKSMALTGKCDPSTVPAYLDMSNIDDK
jgi:hypothetical protein